MKLLLDENIDVRFKFCFDAEVHAIIVVDVHKNVLPNLKLTLPNLLDLLNKPLDKQVYTVKL